MWYSAVYAKVEQKCDMCWLHWANAGLTAIMSEGRQMIVESVLDAATASQDIEAIAVHITGMLTSQS